MFVAVPGVFAFFIWFLGLPAPRLYRHAFETDALCLLYGGSFDFAANLDERLGAGADLGLADFLGDLNRTALVGLFIFFAASLVERRGGVLAALASGGESSSLLSLPRGDMFGGVQGSEFDSSLESVSLSFASIVGLCLDSFMSPVTFVSSR